MKQPNTMLVMASFLSPCLLLIMTLTHAVQSAPVTTQQDDLLYPAVGANSAFVGAAPAALAAAHANGHKIVNVNTAHGLSSVISSPSASPSPHLSPLSSSSSSSTLLSLPILATKSTIERQKLLQQLEEGQRNKQAALELQFQLQLLKQQQQQRADTIDSAQTAGYSSSAQVIKHNHPKANPNPNSNPSLNYHPHPQQQQQQQPHYQQQQQQAHHPLKLRLQYQQPQRQQQQQLQERQLLSSPPPVALDQIYGSQALDSSANDNNAIDEDNDDDEPILLILASDTSLKSLSGRLMKRSGISDQRLAEIQMLRSLKKQLERAAAASKGGSDSAGNKGEQQNGAAS